MSRRRAFDEQQCAHITERLAQGVSVALIAGEYSVSMSTVGKLLPPSRRRGPRRPVLELAGRRFGSWLVKERSSYKPPGDGHSYWVCVCDCGRSGDVRGVSMVSGRSKHCTGCHGGKRKEEK